MIPPDHDPNLRPLPSRRGRGHPVSTAEAISTVRRAIEFLPTGADLTRRAYNDLRRQHPELPSYSSIQRVAKREGGPGFHAGDLVRNVVGESTRR
jgi:hypothetical protein